MGTAPSSWNKVRTWKGWSSKFWPALSGVLLVLCALWASFGGAFSRVVSDPDSALRKFQSDVDGICRSDEALRRVAAASIPSKASIERERRTLIALHDGLEPAVPKLVAVDPPKQYGTFYKRFLDHIQAIARAAAVLPYSAASAPAHMWSTPTLRALEPRIDELYNIAIAFEEESSAMELSGCARLGAWVYDYAGNRENAILQELGKRVQGRTADG